jgi:hypothetical protein
MSTKLRHRLSWLQSPRHAVGGIDGRHGALSAALLDVAEPASAAFPGPNGRIAFASTDGSGSDTDPDWGRDPCTITGSNGSEVLNGTPGPTSSAVWAVTTGSAASTATTKSGAVGATTSSTAEQATITCLGRTATTS